jgi:general secretion pathway protein D
VLNNQTSLLKVVEELVYFTVEVTNTDSTLNAQGRTFVESDVHSVPVGLVMAVTPQISSNQEVTLTVRPTISQKIGDASDPGPQLAVQLNGGDAPDIENLVPIIRTREMESVLKLVNGQVGVLGGLMQDEAREGTREVPGIARVPFVGDWFFSTDEVDNRKTELVIFLRPVIVEQPSIERDLREYGQFLGATPATSAAP